MAGVSGRDPSVARPVLPGGRQCPVPHVRRVDGFVLTASEENGEIGRGLLETDPPTRSVNSPRLSPDRRLRCARHRVLIQTVNQACGGTSRVGRTYPPGPLTTKKTRRPPPRSAGSRSAAGEMRGSGRLEMSRPYVGPQSAASLLQGRAKVRRCDLRCVRRCALWVRHVSAR